MRSPENDNDSEYFLNEPEDGGAASDKFRKDVEKPYTVPLTIEGTATNDGKIKELTGDVAGLGDAFDNTKKSAEDFVKAMDNVAETVESVKEVVKEGLAPPKRKRKAAPKPESAAPRKTTSSPDVAETGQESAQILGLRRAQAEIQKSVDDLVRRVKTSRENLNEKLADPYFDTRPKIKEALEAGGGGSKTALKAALEAKTNERSAAFKVLESRVEAADRKLEALDEVEAAYKELVKNNIDSVYGNENGRKRAITPAQVESAHRVTLANGTSVPIRSNSQVKHQTILYDDDGNIVPTRLALPDVIAQSANFADERKQIKWERKKYADKLAEVKQKEAGDGADPKLASARWSSYRTSRGEKFLRQAREEADAIAAQIAALAQPAEEPVATNIRPVRKPDEAENTKKRKKDSRKQKNAEILAGGGTPNTVLPPPGTTPTIDPAVQEKVAAAVADAAKEEAEATVAAAVEAVAPKKRVRKTKAKTVPTVAPSIEPALEQAVENAVAEVAPPLAAVEPYPPPKKPKKPRARKSATLGGVPIPTSGGGGAGGGGGGGGPLPPIPPDDNGPYNFRIGVDPDFFYKSLLRAIELAESKDPKIRVSLVEKGAKKGSGASTTTTDSTTATASTKEVKKKLTPEEKEVVRIEKAKKLEREAAERAARRRQTTKEYNESERAEKEQRKLERYAERLAMAKQQAEEEMARVAATFHEEVEKPFAMKSGLFAGMRNPAIDLNIDPSAEYVRNRNEILNKSGKHAKAILGYERASTTDEKMGYISRAVKLQNDIDLAEKMMVELIGGDATVVAPSLVTAYDPQGDAIVKKLALDKDTERPLAQVHREGTAYLNQELGGVFSKFLELNPAATFRDFYKILYDSKDPAVALEKVLRAMAEDMYKLNGAAGETADQLKARGNAGVQNALNVLASKPLTGAVRVNKKFGVDMNSYPIMSGLTALSEDKRKTLIEELAKDAPDVPGALKGLGMGSIPQEQVHALVAEFSAMRSVLISAEGPTAKIDAKFADMAAHTRKVAGDTKAMGVALEDIYRRSQRMEQIVKATDILDAKRARRKNVLGELTRGIRGASYIIGGGAVGLTAGLQIREALGTSIRLGEEIASIRGVLPTRSKREAEDIKVGIGSIATKYGVDLLETAQAAKLLAQTGLSATDVLKELDATMLATRGMQISTEAMQDLQIAIRAITDEGGHTLPVLEKISKVEARFAVSAQDLVESLKIASPVLAEFTNTTDSLGDVFDYTIGLTTTLVERLRVTGNQAGNTLKFIFARIYRPDVQKQLQSQFDVRLGATKDSLLELPDLLGELARAYGVLQKSGNTNKANQLAVLVSGGRQVNAMITLLEDYNKSMDIAGVSAAAFGNVHDRASLQVNTLGASIARLKANFQLFTDDLLTATGAGGALQLLVDGLNKTTEITRSGGIGSYLGPTAALVAGSAIAGSGRLLYGTAKAYAGYRRANNAILTDNGISGKKRPLFSSFSDFRTKGGAGLLAEQAGRTVGKYSLEKIAMQEGGAYLAQGALKTALGFFLSPGIITSIIGALVLGGIGKLYTTALERRDKADSLKIKTPGAEYNKKFLESQQFKDFADMAAVYELGSPQEAYSRIREAEAGSSVKAVLGKYGATDITDLVRQLDANIAESKRTTDPKKASALGRRFEGVREELGVAFARDLGSRKLSEIMDPDKLVSEAYKLIGSSKMISTAPVEEWVTGLNATFTAQNDQTNARLKRLVPRTGWRGVADNIGFRFSNREADLSYGQRRLNVIQNLGSKVTSQNGAAVQALLASALPSQQQADAIWGKASISGQYLLEAMREAAELGKSAGYALDQWAKKVNEAGPGQKELISRQIASSYFANTPGLTELAKGLLPINFSGESFSGAGSEGFKLIDELLDRAKRFALENAAKAGKGADTQRSIEADFTRIGEETYTAYKTWLDTNAKSQFTLIKDKLLDLILSIYKDFEKIKVSQNVARRLDLPFDKDTALMGAAQSALTAIESFNYEITSAAVEMGAQIDKLAAQSSNGAALRIVGSKLGPTGIMSDEDQELVRNEGGEEIVTKARRNKALQEQLTGYMSKALTDIIKVGEKDIPEKEVLASLQTLAGFREGTITLVDSLATLVPILEGISKDARRRKLEEARNIASITFSAGLNEDKLNIDRSYTNLIQDPGKRATAEYDFEVLLSKQRLDTLRKITYADSNNISEAGEPTLEAQQKLIDASNEEARKRINFANEQLRDAKQALITQGRENLKNATSGITALYSDLNIWQPLLDGSENAGRDFAAGIVGPITKTFQDRIATQFTDSILEKLSGIDRIKNLFEGPETGMKVAIETAGINAAKAMEDALSRSAVKLAAATGNTSQLNNVSDGTVAGGAAAGAGVAAGAAASALAPKYVSTFSGDITSGLVIDLKRQKPGINLPNLKPLFKKGVDGNNAGLMQASALLGTMTGTALGGGGQFAQIGSTAGALLGGATGIPGLSFVGAAGLGYLGGKLDKKNKGEDRTIAVLEAIERAQKETITTIKGQTDALLNPNSMLLNLPSSFNVPAYNAGAGGSGGDSYVFDFRGADFSGSDPDAVAKQVEQRIRENLGSDRRRSGR